jgi:phage I-like protein
METGSLLVPLENKQGEVPTRVQLLPPGPAIEGRDGRTWALPDAMAVAAASNAFLPNHSIDENHAVDLKAPYGDPSPALGWFSNVAVEANGSLWADVLWTKRGKDAVSNLEYRYLSPVLAHGKDGCITAVLRASLTNNPNLDIRSLNSQTPGEPAKESHTMKTVLAALGLAETATEAEAAAAVAALKISVHNAQPAAVDLAAYAPRADLAAMEARAVEAEGRLAALNAAQLLAEGEAVIDQAVQGRKIPPASKAEYLSLCATREGLEKIKTILAVSPAIIGDTPQAPGGAPAGGQVSLNAAETAAARAAGYTEEEWRKIKAASGGQEAAK